MAEAFFRHAGQVLTREQLLDLVWGYDFDPGSNIVDVYVGYLRRKSGTPAPLRPEGLGRAGLLPTRSAGKSRCGMRPGR